MHFHIFSSLTVYNSCMTYTVKITWLAADLEEF